MKKASPLARVNSESGGRSTPVERDGASGQTQSSTDEIFRILSHRHRRRLITLLDSADDPVPLAEVTAQVTETDAEDAETDDRKAVAVSLQHVHLPTLAAADVVEYDRDTATVEGGENLDAAVRALEIVRRLVSHGAPSAVSGRRCNETTSPCDVVSKLLSDAKRRFVLSHLDERDSQVSLSDLARRVAAWEREKPLVAVTPDERDAAAKELHHVHLPELATTGVLTYDGETNTIVGQGCVEFPS